MSAEGPHLDWERSYTFVLRLWFEVRKEDDDNGEWRGELRDVTTRSRVSFRHLEGLAAAVRELGLTGR